MENDNLYNFNANISSWRTFGAMSDHTWEPKLVELAEEYSRALERTPLLEIFPEETIRERIVQYEIMTKSSQTLLPLVDCGKPDVVLGGRSYGRQIMQFQPLYIRGSVNISHCEINSRVRPGTCNDPWSPTEQIAEHLQALMEMHQNTWDVYRAYMLAHNGLNYTDPRTGVSVKVNAQVPAENFFSFSASPGFAGRNEATAFRSIDDTFEDTDPTQGVPWTEYRSDMVHTVRTLANWFTQTYRGIVTQMYMHPQLISVISQNAVTKLAMVNPNAGLIFNANNNPGTPLALEAPDMHYVNQMTFGANGLLTSIAGIPIIPVAAEHLNPVNGLITDVFPVNKVIMVSNQDNQGRPAPIGRTQYCVSENMGGNPGLWVRTQTESRIPAAPGMMMQIGNAGLPYIKMPHRVMHVTVATPEAIKRRIGILPGNFWHQGV